MVAAKCIQCGCEKQVIPARLKTFKYCSLKCKGEWRKVNYLGGNNPRWQGGPREKICQGCDSKFNWNHKEAISVFNAKKFCTKQCADKHGFRYKGEAHPSYRAEARRKNRGGSHHKWVNQVIGRDGAKCRKCGATNTELHAHHIKSYRDFPELRFDVDNGITLCYVCHWNEHTALNENSVNSGNPLTGHAEGNPEPSLNGNILEGVTTRGRAYRKWFGVCDYCGIQISKRLSDVKGKKNHYCGYSCLGNANAAIRKAKAVNSSKSAGRESDDIV